MGDKIAGYGTIALGLVALYLLLAHASGTTSIAGAGFSGVANVLKTLQGR